MLCFFFENPVMDVNVQNLFYLVLFAVTFTLFLHLYNMFWRSFWVVFVISGSIVRRSYYFDIEKTILYIIANLYFSTDLVDASGTHHCSLYVYILSYTGIQVLIEKRGSVTRNQAVYFFDKLSEGFGGCVLEIISFQFTQFWCCEPMVFYFSPWKFLQNDNLQISGRKSFLFPKKPISRKFRVAECFAFGRKTCSFTEFMYPSGSGFEFFEKQIFFVQKSSYLDGYFCIKIQVVFDIF